MKRGNICCDPFKKRSSGPLALQATHYRPSAPYPRIVLAHLLDAYPYPLPPLEKRQVYPPTQGGKFTLKGPSHTGPFTYFVAFDPWIGDVSFGSGSFKGPSTTLLKDLDLNPLKRIFPSHPAQSKEIPVRGVVL